MIFTAWLVRIYGTRDQYGAEPRKEPSGSPLVYADYPDAGDRVMVFFGSVPEELVEAERARRAIGRVMLDGVLGGRWSDLSPQERIDAAMAEDETVPFQDHNWYVGIALQRSLEVEEFESMIDLVFPPDAMALGDTMAEELHDDMDLLAAVASAFVDESLFRELVLDDRVYLFAEGRRPAGVPVFSGSAEGQLTRTGEALEQLDRDIEALGKLDVRRASQATWLARAAHWRMQALLELDPWKKFLWSFTALEVLSHKIGDQYWSHVVERLQWDGDDNPASARLEALSELVWVKERAPLAAKFAIVAIVLFPTTATDEVKAFRRLKRARDELAHGALREEGDLPVGEVTDLLGRCVAAAVRRLV